MHKKVFTEFENSPRLKLFSKHFIRIWTKQTSNAVCCAMVALFPSLTRIVN